jgi:plastocyanin
MTGARRRPLLVAGLALAAVALAGCSGGATATEAAVATTTVDLPKSYRFDPVAITVEAGAIVTWTNHDEFTHNVTFDGEPALTMRPGESVSRVFEAAGSYPYLCSLHPRDMTGRVDVQGGAS